MESSDSDSEKSMEVCNICLEEFDADNEGECCVCCNDEMPYCRDCLPPRNRFVDQNILHALCDFCGTTFRVDDTKIYDQTFYDLVENEYGISKDSLIENITKLQCKWFDKKQMLERIEATINKLEAEIDRLRSDARYISELRID